MSMAVWKLAMALSNWPRSARTLPRPTWAAVNRGAIVSALRKLAAASFNCPFVFSALPRPGSAEVVMRRCVFRIELGRRAKARHRLGSFTLAEQRRAEVEANAGAIRAQG